MAIVNYYYNTQKDCFIKLAKALGEATHCDVKVEGNSILFPASVGNGSFQFYELEEGFSLLLMNCRFAQPMQFRRLPAEKNDHYVMLFNLNTIPITAKKDSGKIINIGKDWATSVLFSSTGKGVTLFCPANEYITNVVLLFDKKWAARNLRQYVAQILTERAQQLIQEVPLQFTLNMDLNSFNYAQELIVMSETESDSIHLPLSLKGNSIKLLATFLQKISNETTAENKENFTDILRITHIKNKLEKNIYLPVPPIFEAARECLMSRSKFTSLFKKVFKKNYAAYFQELKMQKASELLEMGESVSVVCEKLGYSSVGNFSNAFKSYFHTAPSHYKSKEK